MSAPFGIEIGSSLSELQVLKEMDRQLYFVEAPRPHPSFETYLVQATPQLGVVWVKGLGYTIENDAFGTRVRNVHDEITGQLAKRYGAPEAVDWIVDGALWTEPRDWVMSLTQSERFFFSKWERPRALLPDDLATVFLGLGTQGSDNSWIVLEYASIHSEAADAALQDDLSDLL